jgi:hypothetical protein
MNCREPKYREMLPELAAGSLDDTMKRSLESHLAGCPACLEELQLLEALNSAAVPDPGERFWATLPARVVMEAEQSRPARWSLLSVRDLLMGHRVAQAATVGAAAILLAIFLLWPGTVKDNITLESYSTGITVVEIGSEADLIRAAGDDLEGLDSFLEDMLSTSETHEYSGHEQAIMGMDVLVSDEAGLEVLEEIIDEMLPNVYNRG